MDPLDLSETYVFHRIGRTDEWKIAVDGDPPLDWAGLVRLFG